MIYHDFQILSFMIVILMTNTVEAANRLSVEYQSRYISEGRDNLNADGIYWTGLESDLTSNFTGTLILGQADGSQTDYSEIEATLTYSKEFQQLNVGAGLTYLSFPAEDEFDNELSVAMDWQHASGFVPFANLTYSTEARGYYLEAGLNKTITLSNELMISTSITAGFDYKYLSQQRNQYDHMSINIDIEHYWSTDVLLYGALRHHFAYSDNAASQVSESSLSNINLGIRFLF